MKSLGRLHSGYSVAATVALVLALGGATAYATTHYLITSLHQIKPSVVKALRGQRGPRGLQGKQGNPGNPGRNGAVAGYSAHTTSAVTLTNQSAVTIVSTQLPAGSFVIGGTVSVFGQANPPNGIAVSCSVSGVNGSQAQSFASPVNTLDDNSAQGTLAFSLAVTDPSPETAQISCTDYSGSGGNTGADPSGTQVSVSATLTAIQTSANS